jgi:hypothetical protein
MMELSECQVFQFDPVTDARWPEFVARHPQSSVFHTREWLWALQRTYGYKPVAFTTSTGELSNGVVFCRVRSWLTGSRLVSLPFADHCQPLASGADLQAILMHLHDLRGNEHCRYIEIRPISDEGWVDNVPNFGSSDDFSFHTIDLSPNLEEIYRGFHNTSIRQMIKKAEREQLRLESGNSEELLRRFHRLLLMTRRRHKLPPQPFEWFSNLAHYLGDKLTIHLLWKDATPTASILTLSHKSVLVYKYACSDSRFHNLGCMPLLLWKAIQLSKQSGMKLFDLGRSSGDDRGLIAFKGRLGAVSSKLKYYRTPAPTFSYVSSDSKKQWAREVLVRLPDPVLISVGNLLYRHLG